MTLAQILILTIVSLIGSCLYLTPSFIAFYRDHEKKNLVLLANIFTGWTVVGLFACGWWAFKD
jgi:hypothetical protein